MCSLRPLHVQPQETSARAAQRHCVLPGDQRRAVAAVRHQGAARRALEDFEARFRHHEIPQDLPEQVIEVPADGVAIGQVLKSSGVCPSTSEALRMIEQGGVKVNGEKVADKGLRLAAGATYVLQVGKRKFARVSLRAAP